MPQYQVSHTLVPGALEAASAGVPPVMYQPRNPYASAAYVEGGNGVSPLIGYPSQYPHVVHYTPRPVPASIYEPIPTYADAMSLARALSPVTPPRSVIGSIPSTRSSAPVAAQAAPASAVKPASSQPATSKPAEPTSSEPVQDSPGVYNGKSNIGDNYKLTLQDVATGAFPPLPPVIPSAPAAPVTEPLASSNYRLRDLYRNAQDLVGAPDPVDDSVPVPVSEPRNVFVPTSPVDTQADFMTKTELDATTPMAAGTVVDNTPDTLSDAAATVSDYIRAMMLPYYQTMMQGQSVGKAMRNSAAMPQIGVPALPGTIPTVPVFIP